MALTGSNLHVKDLVLRANHVRRDVLNQLDQISTRKRAPALILQGTGGAVHYISRYLREESQAIPCRRGSSINAVEHEENGSRAECAESNGWVQFWSLLHVRRLEEGCTTPSEVPGRRRGGHRRSDRRENRGARESPQDTDRRFRTTLSFRLPHDSACPGLHR